MSIPEDVSSRSRKWFAAIGLGPKPEARIPDGLRVYAVGDIHGCLKELDLLHEAIERDAAAHTGEKVIVYLGDYVDRGPDSRGVVERLIAQPLRGFKVRFVKGNHDVAAVDFLNDAETYRDWRGFGAPETLLSYGVRPPLFEVSEIFEEARQAFAAALPETHLKFLETLERMIVYGDYAFVHAGIRPGVSLERQDEADLLWIRDEFLASSARHEKIVVHGHTPISSPQRRSNRIAVDTGAYATGILSCAVLEGADCRFIQAKAA